MEKNKVWILITTFSIIGIILASYLAYNYFGPKPLGVCSISDSVNCDEVAKGGSLSTIFGIPVSLIGLAGYIVILISSLLKKEKLAFAMSTFGMLFCLRITFLELFSVRIICPVCLACQIVMIVLFLLSLKLLSNKPSGKAV